MHTPGPWLVLTPLLSEDFVANKDGAAICIVKGDWPQAVLDANARLIAAAPSLLEACEALLTKVGSFSTPSMFFDEIVKAQTAVDKAKGA